MLIFHRLQEIPEIWTSKMSDGTKTSEQTFSRYLLEMSLTDVLYSEKKITLSHYHMIREVKNFLQ